jgi:hypothetical protein
MEDRRFIFEVVGVDGGSPDGRKVALLLKRIARQHALRVRWPAGRAATIGGRDDHQAVEGSDAPARRGFEGG